MNLILMPQWADLNTNLQLPLQPWVSIRKLFLLRPSSAHSEAGPLENKQKEICSLCTACCVMGLFIIIFGVLPEAETKDQCSGATLQAEIIRAEEGAGSLLIIRPPSVSLLRRAAGSD